MQRSCKTGCTFSFIGALIYIFVYNTQLLRLLGIERPTGKLFKGACQLLYDSPSGACSVGQCQDYCLFYI
jgi:hypothetical protein